MSDVSTIPTVKQRILKLLQDRVGLAEVQRTYAHPGKKLGREAIYFDNVTGSHEFRVMKAGRAPRDETYSIRTIVLVRQRGGNIQKAEERAFALLAEIEDALADDPTLGLVPTIHWAGLGEISEVDSGLLDDGCACAIAFEINVKARLS